jgi:hypothetical protein
MYKKLRSWLGQQVPSGPLLGSPTSRDPAELERFAIDQLSHLSKQFSQPGVWIVGRAEDAKGASDSGWKTIVVGAPPGATAVANWSELSKEL